MKEKDLATLIGTGLKELTGRIGDLAGQIEETRAGVRQTQVQIENVRDEIKQLAEGIANVDEKLDRHAAENNRQFDDIRAMMRLSYVQIEQRVSMVEKRYDLLDARLTALESGRH